jgi:uncharacterized MAPEG superfamily protein
LIRVVASVGQAIEGMAVRRAGRGEAAEVRSPGAEPLARGLGARPAVGRMACAGRDTAPCRARGANRALANYVENFTVFAALDLALIATHQPGGWGPTTWILARVLYPPLYLFDVIYVRTIAWAVALVAILTMLARLTWS